MKKVSIILIDWGVRESFHAIDYLNNQTMPRKDYEIIWVEYYNHRPKAIEDYHLEGRRIDKWIVLNKTGMYFKHLMINEGIVASSGEIIVICDSDAMYSPTFVESIISTFDHNDNIILYMEQVRSDNKRFYPFKSVSWEEVLNAPDLVNWDSKFNKPKSLSINHDLIHTRNYGACFSATKSSIIEAGGVDESPSYRSFFCGAYELGWRLVNKDFREIWHQSEWTLHTWHPWVKSEEIMGVSDGFGVNAVAAEIMRTKRTMPLLENEKIREMRIILENGVMEVSQVRTVDISHYQISSKNKLSLHGPTNISGKKISKLKKVLYEAKKGWATSFKFDKAKYSKVLIVMGGKRFGFGHYSCPINTEGMVIGTLRASGLVTQIMTVYFEEMYYRYGQLVSSQKIINQCVNYLPDLIIFTPLADYIDPTKEAVCRIRSELGIKVYIHLFNNNWKVGLKYEWIPRVDYIGITSAVLTPGTYLYDKKFIQSFYGVNPTEFSDNKLQRDIDVTFWGSVPVGSKREEYISFLENNSVKVCTRNYRVNVEEYSEALNRSKIVLSFRREQEDERQSLRERLFEGMACKSLLLEEESSGAKQLFDIGKDFDVFRSKEELLKKIRYYVQHEEERKSIASSGYRKVATIYNARNMWGYIFRQVGFNLPSSLLNDPAFEECSFMLANAGSAERVNNKQ